ncbi:mannose-1-phosphate guanylyltransferase [bacterium]|nr:mannose-1-phosphate guanylyltransferase [bacterium]
MKALIMAGGSGTRFWPKSRERHPKQLLNIYGERTMLQNTMDRLRPLISDQDTFVISTESQGVKIREQLPLLPAQNLIIEPKGKNTAPAIGLAALHIQRLDPEAVMVVLPSDHLITDTEKFIKTLRVGEEAAQNGQLVTIGIEPAYPATGYGYIQVNEKIEIHDEVSILKVKTFAEKPNLATARRFLNSGEFLWNSGIFIWKVQAILNEIEEHLPHLYDSLMEIKPTIGTANEVETVSRVYCQIKSISIDYGVMEYAKEVSVLGGKFGWNDLGSWDEVYKYSDKDKDSNVLVGNHLVKESKHCYVEAPRKSVALLGVDNLIVVDTEDAILICPRDRAQDVKELVEMAKRKNMDHLL